MYEKELIMSVIDGFLRKMSLLQLIEGLIS